jgi:hypothetical protein
MTLGISMLNIIFPLHTRTQNYHLKYPNVLDIIMYIFSLQKLLMLRNIIVLAISGHDTLRPLGIYFRLFANSVYDTKYHKQRSFILQIASLVSLSRMDSHVSLSLQW